HVLKLVPFGSFFQCLRFAMRFRTLQHTLQSSQFSTLSEAAVCHVLVLAPSQAWIDLVQTRRRQIPTSALVECCDELSRARCHDFDLWKSLGEELTCRLTSGRRAQALAMAAPTALESVSVLTSFAGVFCRHRRLLDALESRRDAEGLRSLHTMELKRLLVACGQLKAAVSLGEIAIDFLSHREIGSSLVLLQTVHAAVRLCLFPARQNRFWTSLWTPCMHHVLHSAGMGRDQVTAFAAAVALQQWDCAKRLALEFSWTQWECSRDLAVGLGSLAVLLGLRRASASLLRVGTELLAEACAVFCTEKCLLPTSEVRQLLMFALVNMHLYKGFLLNLPGLLHLLFKMEDSMPRATGRSKSRLQEQVVQVVLMVLHSQGSPLDAWIGGISVEEPCLVYAVDIFIDKGTGP
ncbi:Uncharacterized protein SCF082_LOCUS39623, partial [Durusdinium trenchii]